MNAIRTVFKRELASYFATPVAYVFIVIFLVLAGVFTFYIGNFYERGQADLLPFFDFHPWLYLFLVPAVGMRLWSEERRSGTIESLLTLPVSMGEAVVGKFLAAWIFTAVALLLTVTEWITVSYLGDPDHGVIVSAYVGSFLMAGGFIAIGSCLSAVTKNQVIAFVLSLIVMLVLIMTGYPMVLDTLPSWTPDVVIDALRSFSAWTHFQQIARGVLDLRDVVYFLSLIAVALFVNAIVVDLKKAD